MIKSAYPRFMFCLNLSEQVKETKTRKGSLFVLDRALEFLDDLLMTDSTRRVLVFTEQLWL